MIADLVLSLTILSLYICLVFLSFSVVKKEKGNKQFAIFSARNFLDKGRVSINIDWKL